MIIKENKTIYLCEYCRKVYQVKPACIKHEKYCYKNPRNNHACFNCDFLEVKQSYNMKKTFNCLNKKCKFSNNKLFTFKLEKMIENKNIGAIDFIDNAEKEAIIMPNKCKYFNNLNGVTDLEVICDIGKYCRGDNGFQF